MKWGYGVITSLQNPLVQQARGLLRRKNREERGQFLLEGPKALQEAVLAGCPPGTVFFCPSPSTEPLLALMKEKGWQVVPVNERVLLSMADTATPQELIAVLDQPQSQLDQALKQGTLWLVIDGIQDPGNLGTMLRTAVAAGASGVLMTKGTVDPYNPKAARASAGALFRIPIVTGLLPDELMEKLGEAQIALVATSPRGKIPYYELDMTKRLAVAIGSEGGGLSPALFEGSQVVSIPQAPGIDSLNAAIAAAVLCYEGVRQKLQRGVQPFPL